MAIPTVGAYHYDDLKALQATPNEPIPLMQNEMACTRSWLQAQKQD